MFRLSLSLDSMTLLTPVKVSAVLPHPGLAKGRVMRTVWCLHCALRDGDFFFDDLGLGALADLRQIAFIAPHLGNSCFADTPLGDYATFLQNELKPVLTERLALNPDPQFNELLGISMGAWGAARWALSRPQAFSRAYLLSGCYDFCAAPDPRIRQDRLLKGIYMVTKDLEDCLFATRGVYREGCDLHQLLDNCTPGAVPELELYCGSEDYLTLNSTEDFYRQLQQRGISSSLSLISGTHDRECWIKMLAQIFRPEAVLGERRVS